jgi:YidC/Oxa1 family membrane protein insertase
MDRKAIIIIAASVVLLILWYPLVNKLYPPRPVPPRDTNAVATATATNVAPTPAATSAPPSLSSATTTNVARPIVATNVAEQTITLTNENARYVFTSHGGGLKLVELIKYPETVSQRRTRERETSRFATLNKDALAPTLALLSSDEVQGDGVFALTPIQNGVRAEKTLPNGLRIVKEFQLSTNYLLTAVTRFENTSTQTLALPQQEWVVGTATPMNAQDPPTYVGAIWYNGSDTETMSSSHFSKSGFACMPRTPPAEYRHGASNVVWVAAHNQYFALLAMLPDRAMEVVARKIDLPRPTPAEAQADSRLVKEPEGYQTAVVYPGLQLAPAQAVEKRIQLFAGPKEYQTLARIATRFGNEVDAIMEFDNIFPFYRVGGFFGKALLLGLNWLHNAWHLPYGWAIVTITIIIKILFWPLTQISTRSAKRMQALAPQLKALQEKYKDDPQKFAAKQLEVWRQNKVNPMSGCWPMLLQMPVFFGFFTMIRSAIELRGEPWLWVGDLSRPDTIFMIPGVNFPFNPLPLLMGATMLWQSHLTPPSPGMDPMQQKMMRYMPLIFLVFLYNFSAGLTLYWTVQNLLTILQTKLTKTATEKTPAPPTPVKTPARAPGLTPPQKKRK